MTCKPSDALIIVAKVQKIFHTPSVFLSKFLITGYYDRGRLLHAGSRDIYNVVCPFPLSVALCDRNPLMLWIARPCNSFACYKLLWYYLARSAKLPEGLYILPMFFLYFIFYFF